VLHIGRDITLRKAAERQLSLVNFALNRVREAAYLIDERSRFLYVNDESCRVLGYRREELIALGVTDIDPDFPAARWDRHWQELKTAGSLTFETTHKAREGAIIPVEVTANYFEYDGVGYNLALVRDITLRKQAAAALLESEQRFRQVTDNIDEVFWLTDLAEQRVIYISPAYEKIWGRTCESLHADPQSWLKAIHPEDAQRIEAGWDGLQAGKPYDVEYRILRPDGSVRWIQDRAFPVRDPDGTVRRNAGVATDITVRRQLEDQFRQAQRMEAVGQLAGGVAHDFNNLLAVIQMQSSLLLEMPSDADYLREGVQQILAASKSAANLTRQLLTFSRRSVRQVKIMDLGEVADHLVKLLARLLGETVTIQTSFAPLLPSINADPGMMEQVIMNLAVNARDAMPDGGKLSIAVSAANIGKDSRAAHPHALPGEYVRLSVGDTGCGIPRQNLARIFEPFFTTKEPGRGTGLGLATVFGIVEQHHGWIEVASELNRGTTFTVFLPALPHVASSARTTPGRVVQAGGNETILLVEDELSVRAIARLVLERYGYRVLEAGSAAEALRCWDTQGVKIDLLLTDIVMPGGMSGRQLGKQLTRLNPTLKIIYTTGYNPEMADPAHASENAAGCDDFLQKPYAISDLAQIVRRNLDGPKAARSSAI
jgi:two-component system cell cycle sensor histidine kinase/response regulator CckA